MLPQHSASKALLVLSAVALCISPVGARRQTPAADYSKEPYVIEHLGVKVVFEADGTQTRDIDMRVRLQSAAALQDVGTVSVPYSRELTTLDVKYIRSRKPDGSVVDTPAASAIDLPADITRQAPTYTDLYVKQFNVRGLAVGDTVEYAFRLRTKSLIPGQFWMEQQWTDEGIVLAEDIDVSMPASAAAKVKTFGEPQPVVETSQGLQTYRWHHANLKRLSAQETAVRNYERRTHPADVRLSSFQNWADVGAAIRELWRGRADVTPQIRDKAVELTRDLKTDDEKLAALYAFVSTKIRYVAISLGVGRIQPHAATEVLENGFGDCKDKSTLLTALLAAIGITAESALIAAGVPLDADVPSISQFNHVITTVATAGQQTWLDTTLEVAPLGLLVGVERDQSVLLVPASGPARLVKTPATPSRPSSWRTESVGTINEAGKLDATIREVISGDAEVLLRTALRAVPQNQWTEAAKNLPLPSRFGGSVSDLVVSPLEDTTAPLTLSYHYSVDAFSEWARREVSAAVPFITYPPAPGADAPAVPLTLGGPIEFEATSRLTLPSGFAATLGADAKPDVLIDQDFARYRMQNRLDGRVFETHRVMTYKQKEVAPPEFPAYRKFIGEFAAGDYSVNLRPLGWAWGEETTIEWYAGETPANRKVLQDAAEAAGRGDRQSAETMVRDLIRTNPASEKAAMMLAWIQLTGDKRDEGVATLRKRLAASPTPDAYKVLASSLPAAEAVDVWREGWRKFGKTDDEFALYLGESLVTVQQYSEAVRVLETQAQKQAKSSRFQWDFGRALVGDKKRDAGVRALRAAAELDPRPLILNNVAWELAIHSLALDDALALANRAVDGIEEETGKLALTKVDATALGVMSSLGYYWDTLAWTHFKLGHLEDAERYQLAAWDLMTSEINATHLSEMAAARHDVEDSSMYTEMATALHNSDRDAAMSALKSLVEQYADLPPAASARRAWTLSLPRLEKASGKASAYVLSGPDGKITDVAFIDGDTALRPQADALRGLTLPSRLPLRTKARLLRRGELVCSAGSADCQFVLVTATRAATLR